jgi:hypothetical protein
MKNPMFPFPMITVKNARDDGTNVHDVINHIKLAEDNLRKEMLLKAKLCGVGIVHIKSAEGEWRKGGMTVAFKKSNQYKYGRMVEVAVAVCSPEDTFSRKIGTQMALEKFFSEQVIELPLLEFYGQEDINMAVKKAFTAMWHAI